jgi:hypothetical protein
LGRRRLDSSVNIDPIRDHPTDDSAGELAGSRVCLDLRQLPLQDRRRRSLAEIRLEHGGERDPPAGAQRPDAVAGALSHRRRRSGR